MILVIFLYATALLLPFSGSALVVYFTLFSYFYIVDETPKFSRAPKFLRRTPRDAP